MKKITLLITFIFSIAKINAQQTVPYINDFELADTTWHVVTTSGSSWQWGMPSSGNPSGAHSGVNCWDVALNAQYVNNTDAALYSPPFNFTGTNNAKIFLNYFSSCEQSWDGTRLDYSIDGGLTWALMYDSSTINWYNYALINSSGLPAWSGNNTAWAFSFTSTSVFANQPDVRLRFAFTSDAVVTGEGFAIDDFGILPDAAHLINGTVTFANPPCGAGSVANFNLMGFTGDTINTSGTATAQIFFGDGTDTTFSISYANNFYYQNISHTYNLTGLFTTQYIVTDQNNVSDTLVKPGQVFIDNNCGNIAGQVYYDLNGDCVFNAGDTAIANTHIQINISNGMVYHVFTDITGNYSINVPNGFTYTVQLINSFNPVMSSVCPASATYNITTLPSSGNNFGIYCSPAFDLSASVFGWGYVPGQSSTINLSIGAHSCSVINATAYFVLPSLLHYASASPTPTQINGDTLIWNFNTNPVLNYTSFTIFAVTDTTVEIGDTICVNAWVEPVATDTLPLNNYATYCRAAAVSCDPNEKHVNPEGAISATQDLQYAINFQNTGNATAYNIYLLDTFDANLDVTTLRILGSSHSMTSQVLPGNVLHFTFNNILLPDSNSNEPASHGYVHYAIKPIATIAPGTTIENTAAIYFDFNAPVITNTTQSVIQNPVGVNQFSDLQNAISIKPNPATDKLTLIVHDKNLIGGKIIISDVIGNVVMEKIKSDNATETLDIRKLSKGFYTISIENAEQNLVRKFVKE